ncbi:unnamed protein product [Parnassius mnemosyne]|uniref:Uncharacterized protein n=1 Tax=Parnassius mnemosyne TaxID=213953 RepID=A0AAV1KPM1_9NEOP
MCPLYSPDLVTSDFHLFRSLPNSLGTVWLTSREDCHNYLLHFFKSKIPRFLLQRDYVTTNKMTTSY